MMKFELQPEPENFQESVRTPGIAWLMLNPMKQPKNFWKSAKGHLRRSFQNLCSYSCVFSSSTSVDHYLSKSRRRDLAYEWSNYRHCMPEINSFKGTFDDKILDPFEVEDGWFEIILPSCILKITSSLPPELTARALFTIEKLHLNDEVLLEQRFEYYCDFKNSETSLAFLKKNAPLIAKACEQQTDINCR